MFKVKRRFGGGGVYTVYAVNRTKNGGAEFLIFKPMIKKFEWVDSELFAPIDVKE